MYAEDALKRAAGTAMRLMSVLVMGVGLGACDLDSVLAVDLPGKVVEGDLADPRQADLLVNSAISAFECAWSMYTAAAAHHSDEIMNASGNNWWRDMGWRQHKADEPRLSSGTCTTAYSIYAPLHSARFLANNVYNRLEEGGSAVTNLQVRQATLRAYGGYALVGLGEAFCEMTIPAEEGVPGPLYTPRQVLEAAEARFTEALALSPTPDIRNMALVGRARVRLSMGDWAGVIADASLVPATFVKNASRGDQEPRRYNQLYNAVNSRIQSAMGTVSTNYRNLRLDDQGRPFEGPLTRPVLDANAAPAGGDGVADTRVTVITYGRFGHNETTPLWHNVKHTSRTTPVPIATGREARMFLAEAYIRTGELQQGLDVLNELRATHNLPAYTAEVNPDAMIRLLIEERRREFFVEGAHRLVDMLRFRGTGFNIPFQGEPGSIHPSGSDHVGGTYGDTICFPLPFVERIGNPNIGG
jgi:hypothetical protein